MHQPAAAAAVERIFYCIYGDNGGKHVVMLNDGVNLTLYDDDWSQLISATAWPHPLLSQPTVTTPGAADLHLQADAEPPWRHRPTPQSAHRRPVLPG